MSAQRGKWPGWNWSEYLKILEYLVITGRVKRKVHIRCVCVCVAAFLFLLQTCSKALILTESQSLHICIYMNVLNRKKYHLSNYEILSAHVYILDESVSQMYFYFIL